MIPHRSTDNLLLKIHVLNYLDVIEAMTDTLLTIRNGIFDSACCTYYYNFASQSRV